MGDLGDTTRVLVSAAILLLVGFYVFRIRVRHDYRTRGKLTPLSSALQVFAFFVHGVSSYLFLDGDLAHIDRTHPAFFVALLSLSAGFALLFLSVTGLGVRKTVGLAMTGLQSAGLYRLTRNPQIIAYSLLVLGYSLLWPSWPGVLWVAVYAAIAHMMVLTEEEHLRGVYGEEYAPYCARVPRYLNPFF